MLFAGWEVRMVKNCDRGLENTAQGRRPVNNIFIVFKLDEILPERTRMIYGRKYVKIFHKLNNF